MKLSKTNTILSYTSLLLMVYSLICLCLLNSQWYKVNWFYLDKYDLGFYLFAYLHFFVYRKKYKFMAKTFLFCVTLYLGFKILDNHYLFNCSIFIFWNIYILVILPILIWVSRNLNR